MRHGPKRERDTGPSDQRHLVSRARAGRSYRSVKFRMLAGDMVIVFRS